MKKNGNKPKHMGVSEGQRLLGALNGDKAEMPKPPSYEALVCTCLQSAQMSAENEARARESISSVLQTYKALLAFHAFLLVFTMLALIASARA